MSEFGFELSKTIIFIDCAEFAIPRQPARRLSNHLTLHNRVEQFPNLLPHGKSMKITILDDCQDAVPNASSLQQARRP